MEGRGGRLGVGVLAPTLLAALLVLALPSCKRPAPPAPGSDAYSWPAAETRIFAAGPEGLSPLLSGSAPASPAASAQAGELPRVAAVAAGPGSEALALAIEGWGLAFVDAEGGASRLHLARLALPGMAGLRVGGLWPREGAWLLHLYRDPFSGATRAAGEEPRPGLFAADNAGLRRLLPSLPALAGSGTYEPFALLPDPGQAGSWLVQLRDSSGPETRSRFFHLPRLDLSAATSLDRADFEASLAPRALSSAPATLQSALAALGEAAGSSALIRLAEAGGGAAWYRFGDDPFGSREIQAWRDRGGSTLLLLADGQAVLARSGGGSALPFSLPLPLEGAWFTGAAFSALVGGKALVILASWEEGGGRGASGILVAPLSLP